MALESMEGKQGAWVKPGKKGSHEGAGKAPGSYGDYLYVRAPPADYKKTAQQEKIGDAARECAEEGKDLDEIQGCIRNQF